LLFPPDVAQENHRLAGRLVGVGPQLETEGALPHCIQHEHDFNVEETLAVTSRCRRRGRAGTANCPGYSKSSAMEMSSSLATRINVPTRGDGADVVDAEGKPGHERRVQQRKHLTARRPLAVARVTPVGWPRSQLAFPPPR
jgi:hypothetical protein